MMECPNCGSGAVNSVAATQLGTKVGEALRSSGERSSSVGYAAFDSMLAAKDLRPPKKPTVFVPGVIVSLGILVVLLIASFVIAPAMTKDLGALSLATLVGFVTAGITFFFLIALALMYGRQSSDRANYPKQLEAWNRLMYCYKCNIVFNPDTMQWTPAQMAKSLLTAKPTQLRGPKTGPPKVIQGDDRPPGDKAPQA